MTNDVRKNVTYGLRFEKKYYKNANKHITHPIIARIHNKLMTERLKFIDSTSISNTLIHMAVTHRCIEWMCEVKRKMNVFFSFSAEINKKLEANTYATALRYAIVKVIQKSLFIQGLFFICIKHIV